MSQHFTNLVTELIARPGMLPTAHWLTAAALDVSQRALPAAKLSLFPTSP